MNEVISIIADYCILGISTLIIIASAKDVYDKYKSERR